MCVYTKYIWNRYIGRHVLVNCGSCPSCQQQKASSRASRIRSNLKDGEICLFVTLTYKNEYVPYIDINNLQYGANFDTPIRRHSDGRFVRCSADYKIQYRQDSFNVDGNVIDFIPLLYFDHSDISKRNPFALRSLTGRPSNEVGICYYPDVQDFMKRLRQNLLRHYNYDKKFTYFSCSEYGGHTQRPHFHLLFFIPSNFEQVFRVAIVESWPFADNDRTAKFIEVARDCASYVASYVNGNSCLSEVLTSSFTRQKHSYSKGFGLGLSSFSFGSLLEKINDRNLTYNREVSFNGIKCNVTLPVPQYVIYRLFPKFKGFSRCSTDTLYRILRFSTDSCLSRTRDSVRVFFRSLPEFHKICWTEEECRAIVVRLRNCYLRFQLVSGLGFYDYIDYFIRCWNLYSSQQLSLSHSGKVPDDYKEFYDNIPLNLKNFHPSLSVLNLMSDFGFSNSDFVSSPNLYRDRVSLSQSYEQTYYARTKQKVFINKVMSCMGFDV